MSVLLERLETRLASRLSLRDRPSWICPECRASRQHRRRLNTRQPLEQDNLTTQASRSPAPAIFTRRRYDAAVGTPVGEIAQTEQWRDAQQQSLQSLRDFVALGLPEESNLARGLQHQDSETVSKAIVEQAGNSAFFAPFTVNTWSEIWRTMDPQKVFLPLHRRHRSMNTRRLGEMGFDYDERRDDYMKRLASLIQIRQHHGPPMTIVDYQLLFTYVARIGDERGARSLWADMKTSGIAPDRECYNRYMEALIWNEESRVKQLRKGIKTVPHISPQFTDIALFKPGQSKEITELFNEMAAGTSSPDTATMCVLMQVLARDGEFKEAARVLERVWSVDVEAVLDAEDVPELRTTYAPSSPLYPTQRLLVTIADVYGLANEIPAGIRIIDYIARQYDIPLKGNVWHQVLRWASLQARVKPNQRRNNFGGTQIDLKVVNKLIDIMEKEYDIEPGMDIYNISFRTMAESPYAFAERFMPENFIQILESGFDIYKESQRTHRKLWEHTNKTTSLGSRFGLQGIKYNRLRVQAETAMMKRRQNMKILEGWLAKFISLPRSKTHKLDWSIRPRVSPEDISDWRGEGLANLTEWRLRGFQNFLEKWERYVPGTIKYSTDTGIVELMKKRMPGIERQNDMPS